jgi:hypothetical protein
LPLDPALAEVLFNWKRKSLFAQESDWVFASVQKAENSRCDRTGCWQGSLSLLTWLLRLGPG